MWVDEMAIDILAEAPEAAVKPVTVISPPQGWQLLNLRELWQFRDLFYFLIWRDVKVRYKQTVLGAAWAVLQPAMMMVVFTIFFSRMAGVPAGDLPYPLFAFAGLLPWTFFATAIANAGNSIIGSERLITKVYFPRLAIPFAAVGAAVVDFLVASILLFVMMAYYHDRVALGPGLLLAPVIVAMMVLIALGIGTLLAALNVAYRDFRYIIPFLIQFGMFATPTVYMQPPADGGSRFYALLSLNPMTGLIAAFRAAVLGGPMPWADLAAAAVIVLLAFLASCFYFRRVEDSFADII
jgi:lipopolysaccharide transport system permease protein